MNTIIQFIKMDVLFRVVFWIGLIKRGQIISFAFNSFFSDLGRVIITLSSMVIFRLRPVEVFIVYASCFFISVILKVAFHKYKVVIATSGDVINAENIFKAKSKSIIGWADSTAELVSKRIDSLAAKGEL